MSEPTRYDTRTVALLASIALASLLALAATWIAALGRVPQQRAAVERLLGAQTGLDVRYGRLVVRLGFYGPEAEFSHIEMYQPGADAPVLRAPQMVARFESWRLLRGGQLRPGRVRVSGAEIDLRQLSGLSIGRRRADAAARIDMGPAATGSMSQPAVLTMLESRLPRLLAGLPEGSLDFEAVTLVWTDPARPAEPLQLRAPRLYASRRADGVQLSGTLLLPARFGRTLFVSVQLRGEPRDDRGTALDGRLRLSGRGLVLASWRKFGLLPEALLGGTGDVAVTVQLRSGRVQQASGDLRIAGLGLVVPGLVLARRFSLGAAEFDFTRTATDGLRWRLQQVELVPTGGSTGPFAARGLLELEQQGEDGAGTLRLRRLPIEVAALLAARAGRDGWPVGTELRLSAGDVIELESSWPASVAASTTHGRFEGLAVASADGRWGVEQVDAELDGDGDGQWRLRLQGRELALQAPGLESLPQPLRAAVDGEVGLTRSAAGWSLSTQDLALRFATGPALRIGGSAAVGAAGAAGANGAMTSRLTLDLAEPLPRTAMTLPQAALQPIVPAAFWDAFAAGELATARLEVVDGRFDSAELTLRELMFAGDATRPAIEGLGAALRWDGRRLDGSLDGGRIGPLQLESGRVAWTVGGGARNGTASRRNTANGASVANAANAANAAKAASAAAAAAATAPFEIEAQLAGTLQEALRLAGPEGLPDGAVAGAEGQVQVLARLRLATPTTAGSVAYQLDIADGRWQPLAGAAPLTGLHGRLQADAQGLREGSLEGQWLDGPVRLRLTGGERGALQLAANGRFDRAALASQWPWVELVEQARRAPFEWSAELRREGEAPAAAPRSRNRNGTARSADRREPAAAVIDVAALPWQLRITAAGALGAELYWMPQADRSGWRLDRGVVRVGDAAAALAGIPGGLVVGGELERLDLGGLAGVLARLGGGAGWQRPLVGEVAVAELAAGGTSFGSARLRLAGSPESTTVELQGEALAGELRQLHADAAPLQLRFARLVLPVDGSLAALAEAFMPARNSLELQVAELRRGTRPLGELTARFEADGEGTLLGHDLLLRRGARRLQASGRCEHAALSCNAEFTLADADLAELQRDLGWSASLRGSEVAARGRLAWSMQPAAGFAASLQGEVELSARLEGRIPVPLEAGPDRDAAMSADALSAAPAAEQPPEQTQEQVEERQDELPPSWSLLAPLIATVAEQRAALVTPTTPATRTAIAAPGSPPSSPPARPAGGTAAPSPAAGGPGPANIESMLALDRLELQLALRDGVASIERYQVSGRDARVNLSGVFDFRQGTVEQQAEWHWIAPGVAGAVEHLDPRSPLASGLRTLRELFAARRERSAAEGGPRAGATEHFVLAGPLQQPRLQRQRPAPPKPSPLPETGR
ncbi:MAG: hypothetical protein H7A16_04740 [Sinobacteraceae bacterium]|nr:hypothetical protein [Nevskiaceae bacterium]